MDYRIQEPGNIVVRGRADLLVSSRSERGKEYFFVEDPLRNTFYRLGKSEYALLAALDGTRTLDDAVAAAACKRSIDALNLQQALALVKWLIDSGLATTDAGTSQNLGSRRNAWSRFNPWFFQFTIGNPDRFLRRLEPLGNVLLSRGFFAAWLIAAAAALTIVVGDWTAISAGSPLQLGWRGTVALLIVWCALKCLHELGHALACRQVGGAVGGCGVALVLGMPSPFVDVSNIWRHPERRKRILVSLAGVYVETFAASLATVVWALTDDGFWRQTALTTAVVASIGTLLFNLNPLMRFDGYFVLADWADVANLAPRARSECLRVMRRYLLGLNEPTWAKAGEVEPRWLAAYGFAAATWRVLAIVGLLSLALYRFGPWPTAILGAVPLALCLRRVPRLLSSFQNIPIETLAFRRAALTWGVLVCVGWEAISVIDPLTLEVPAVVDYRPLEIVRAAAPGFVREVLVADGDAVEAGRPLARLENAELAAEFEQLKYSLQQHLARARMHRKAGAIAKEQAELRQRDACEVKLTHVAARLESLVVRAPVAGRIVSRGLKDHVGCWLAEGSPIAMIGEENSKEVVAALSQGQINAISPTDGKHVVVLKGESGAIRLRSVVCDPRAVSAVFHPALSVEHGGRIAVRRRDLTSADAVAEKTFVSEFYEPHFRISGELDHDVAAGLDAGRTATLRIRTSWMHAVSGLWSRFDKWLNGGGPPNHG